MIVFINLSQKNTEATRQKVTEKQEIIERLEPKLGTIPILEFIDDDTVISDSLFEQQFYTQSETSVPLYSNELEDYRLFIEGSDAVVMSSDLLQENQMFYQTLFQNKISPQRIVFSGTTPAIKMALAGDEKPYALCLKKGRLPELLSLSEETLINSMPSELLTDPLFEDVPMVFIYDINGNGYVIHHEEIFQVLCNDETIKQVNHEGMLCGLAAGLSNKDNSTEEIIKQAIICSVAAKDCEETVFDEQFFVDKITVVKLA